LAWYVQQSEHPNSNNPSNWHPRIQSIQPGEQTRITLYLRLPGNDEMQAELKEQHRIPGGPWTLETLPEELKQKLNQLRQQRFSSEAGGAPPPPPMRAA
jgi:hypothetical protein